jgi:hypothetical protein
MYGQLFTLVHAADPDTDSGEGTAIFAWGMQITTDTDQFAVIYRRDRGGHSTFGVHGSADRACALYSRLVPLRVMWENSELEHSG